MTAPAVGIAILGAGIFAREAHVPAIKALGPSVSLKAIYSRSKSSADALALLAKEALDLTADIPTYYDAPDPNTPVTHDLDALLADKEISAVIIALPISTQPAVILKSLAAGKHILSEKPIASTLEEGLSLIKTYNETYKSKGIHWRVAENFECEPIFHAARAAIEKGKIGEVRHFDLRNIADVQLDNKWYKTPWRTIPDFQGGFVYDGGVHSAAAIRTILPESNQPVSLSAHASLSWAHLVPIDTINVLFTLASPPVTDTTPETPKNTPPHGVFQLSYASPLKARNENRIAVTGTKGFLEITSFNIPLLGPHWRLTIHSGRGTNDATEEIVEKNQGVEQELHHFAKLILGKGDDGFGHLKGALADVEFIEKSLKSGGAELKLDATSGL